MAKSFGSVSAGTQYERKANNGDRVWAIRHPAYITRESGAPVRVPEHNAVFIARPNGAPREVSRPRTWQAAVDEVDAIAHARSHGY